MRSPMSWSLPNDAPPTLRYGSVVVKIQSSLLKWVQFSNRNDAATRTCAGFRKGGGVFIRAVFVWREGLFAVFAPTAMIFKTESRAF